MITGHKEVTVLLQQLKESNKKALVYAGFDPTGNSLHIGHLGVISLLKRFEDEGHHVRIILGTGTAFIGDPTGKNEIRKMLSQDVIEKNTDGIINDINRVLSKPNFIRNDWLRNLNFQDFMREAGSRIPLNDILNLSIVKTRLESGSGITLMEAIYPVLQGWDMVMMSRLAKEELDVDTVIQIGGKDQGGNISMGLHLSKRLVDGIDALGVLSELITTADGVKMGKTAGNAIFLNPTLTDDLLFFDSIMSVSDSLVDSMIKVLLPEMKNDGDIIKVKKKMAIEITKWVRGETSLDNILTIKNKGFDEGELKTIEINNKDISVSSLLKESGLTSSLTEGRKLIKNNGVKIDGEEVKEDTIITSPSNFILSKGKKNHVRVILT